MADQTQETQIALLLQKQEQMEGHLKNTDAAVLALQAERNHALKWGIIVLGSSVLGMGSWIFNYFSGHLK